MIGVRTATFYRLPDRRLMMICTGSFPRRALPLLARVGSVDVEGISISPDGTTLTGLLRTTPNAGDELVVRYLPEPATRTRLRFPTLAVA